MRTVPLYGKHAQGRMVLVDDEDFGLVSPYRWRAWVKERANGSVDGPYALAEFVRNGRRKVILMHKLITGWPMTDHRNGDGLDNQRSNLRPTTAAQNNHNQRPVARHSSRFKGVTWHKRAGKWQASIKVSGKSHYLGCFASEEEASQAYIEAALIMQGEYAYAARDASEGAA